MRKLRRARSRYLERRWGLLRFAGRNARWKLLHANAPRSPARSDGPRARLARGLAGLAGLLGLIGLMLLGAACRPPPVGLPTLTATLTGSAGRTPTSAAAAATQTAALTAAAQTAAAETAAPQTPSPVPTWTPIVYVVQPGDSLSGIAYRFDVPIEQLAEANDIDDPNVIAAGQRLVIPGPTQEPTATVPPTATPTPETPPQLEIVDVIGRGAPGVETVIIANRGRAVSLTGWTLRDAQGNAYVFPNLYLASGTEVRVHTGAGEDTPLHLYWNRETAVWAGKDTAVLADPDGVMYAAKPLE
jgi:LysM repeat protein